MAKENRMPPVDSARHVKREGGEITLPLFPSNRESEREEIPIGSYGEEITIGSYIEGGAEEEISTETDGDEEEVTGFCREEEIKTAEDEGEEEIKTVEDEINSAEGKGEEEDIARKPLSLAINYRKSTATIMKKAKELSTLCDIPVCVGIISPKGSITETWPESRSEVKNIWNSNLKNIQIYDNKWNLSETNVRSSQPLKIIDDHDEIMNALNSKIAAVDKKISFLQQQQQQQQKENVENCSNIGDQEKNLVGQKTNKKSDEQKSKRGRLQ